MYKSNVLKKEVWPSVQVASDKNKSEESFEMSEQEVKSYRALTFTMSPEWIPTCYLMNPYSLLSCTALSLGLLTNASILTSLFFATRQKPLKSCWWLAIATYLGFYPIALLPPCLLLCFRVFEWKTSLKAITFFIGSLCFLFGLSFLLLGSWDFLASTYGSQLTVQELSPNMGLFWYFFIEVFESFKTFFICLFQFLVFIFVLPITLRFSYVFFSIIKYYKIKFIFI